MMLTALGQPEEIISGLEHGADDYVTKPFHPREVALRAQALVRRGRGVGTEPAVQVGRLRIDPTQHVASLAGQRLELPFTEFKLLAHLAAHRGVPQPWRTLLQAVWGAQNLAGGRDIVKSAVYRLRSRLAALDDGTEYIVTLRGVGYLLSDLPPAEHEPGTAPRR
jgi:DNA-binding response OmpR family regulator